MSEHSFFGYMRSDGNAGVRNYVLILPIHRSLKFIASMVERMTRGTLRFDMPAETGVRRRIARRSPARLSDS